MRSSRSTIRLDDSIERASCTVELLNATSTMGDDTSVGK
jgi:hypothetical protein